MKEIKVLIEPSRLYDVVLALRGVPSIPEFTVSDVRVFPAHEFGPQGHGQPADPTASREMFEVECVVPDELTRPVLQAIERAAPGRSTDRGRAVLREVEEVAKADVTRVG